jgi:hypothetical protein
VLPQPKPNQKPAPLHDPAAQAASFNKGMGLAGGWDPKIIVSGLLLNGVWGLGTALLIRLLNQVTLPQRN